MADISSYLSDIMSAVYGEEVRESIRNAIDAIDAEVQDLKGYIATMAGMTNMWYISETPTAEEIDEHTRQYVIPRSVVADSTIQVIWTVDPTSTEDNTASFTQGVSATEGALSYDGDKTFTLDSGLDPLETYEFIRISYYTNDSDANSITNYINDSLTSALTQRLSPRSGTISYASGWGAYSTSETPVLKKVGNNVTFYGAFKFTGSEFTLNGTDKETIATIPEEYRPEKSVNALCQGSGSFAWLITVSAIDGTVAISRFRNESNVSQSINASRWFPFSLSWTTAE